MRIVWDFHGEIDCDVPNPSIFTTFVPERMQIKSVGATVFDGKCRGMITLLIRLRFLLDYRLIGLYYYHIAHCNVSQCPFECQRMTKQLITKTIFDSANIRHKDADTLASLILVAIRDKIASSGEVRLPGIGTFVTEGKPKRIGKKSLAAALEASGLAIGHEDALVDVFLGHIEKEIGPSCSISLPTLGSLSLTEVRPGNSKRSVRFRASPLLLGAVDGVSINEA